MERVLLSFHYLVVNRDRLSMPPQLSFEPIGITASPGSDRR
jgi:hypothetical protein